MDISWILWQYNLSKFFHSKIQEAIKDYHQFFPFLQPNGNVKEEAWDGRPQAKGGRQQVKVLGPSSSASPNRMAKCKC